MKSRNEAMNVEGSSKAVSKLGIAAGGSKSAPSPEEVCRRAFDICIERVGIDCCDLHDWLQAERELQEKHKETAIGARKKRIVETITGESKGIGAAQGRGKYDSEVTS